MVTFVTLIALILPLLKKFTIYWVTVCLHADSAKLKNKFFFNYTVNYTVWKRQSESGSGKSQMAMKV